MIFLHKIMQSICQVSSASGDWSTKAKGQIIQTLQERSYNLATYEKNGTGSWIINKHGAITQKMLLLDK